MEKPATIRYGMLPAASRRRDKTATAPGRSPRRYVVRIVAVPAVLSLLYFGVLGSLMQRVDARTDFVPTAAVENGSHAVNMAEALIVREVETHRWAPNDPVFFPTAFHDNMGNFQRGLMRAVSRFTLALETQIGRLNGTAAIDGDLERAAGLLQFPTDVWFFDLEQSFLPVQSADSQYRTAAAALAAYNARVATGSATFERRADALVLTLERMIGELGARAALIDQHLQQSGGLIDRTSDDIFYYNKGMSYATFMLLRELGRDYESVLVSNGVEGIWTQMLDSLETAARQRPLVVLSASRDGSIFANHLHLQGFYLKRALLQLEEVGRALRNQR
jgi:hypothetical protein